MKKKIGIIDTGCSNIFSVKAATKLIGYDYMVSSKIQELKNFNKIILPGVGHFGYVMQKFNYELKNFLKEFVNNGNFLLGICLGMQILLEDSEESNDINGLKIINGSVKKINLAKDETLPHISWKTLNIVSDDKIFKGIKKNEEFYFIHSYFCDVKKNYILANTNYGNKNFPSVIKKNNCYAVQFHPEKSKKQGLKIIKNFLEF